MGNHSPAAGQKERAHAVRKVANSSCLVSHNYCLLSFLKGILWPPKLKPEGAKCCASSSHTVVERGGLSQTRLPELTI